MAPRPRRRLSRAFVDLTGDTSPAPTSKPRSEGSTKRKRIDGDQAAPSSKRNAVRPNLPDTNVGDDDVKEIPAIEEVDLREVDDDHGLSKVLENQRKAAIKRQQIQAALPTKLSSLQCIICMDNMGDVTTTNCGE